MNMTIMANVSMILVGIMLAAAVGGFVEGPRGASEYGFYFLGFICLCTVTSSVFRMFGK